MGTIAILSSPEMQETTVCVVDEIVKERQQLGMWCTTSLREEEWNTNSVVPSV